MTEHHAHEFVDVGPSRTRPGYVEQRCVREGCEVIRHTRPDSLEEAP